MRITFVPEADTVKFTISDFEPKYAAVLQGLFYQPEGSSFIKRFPSALATDQVQANFARYAPTMIDQIGGFAPVPWDLAIEGFARRAQSAGITWWLTGSCALAIRGIPVVPHDVDIMLRSEDLPSVESALGEFIVEPVIPTTGWIMKRFGVAFLEARIDLAFDPEAGVDRPQPADFGPYAMEHLETVVWRGLEVRVPPAALHLAGNRQRGRLERVRLIEDYLSRLGT